MTGGMKPEREAGPEQSEVEFLRAENLRLNKELVETTEKLAEVRGLLTGLQTVLRLTQ